MSVWDDEYPPPALVQLGVGVRTAFGLVPVAIGTKGDVSHTYGYHRSRRWIATDGDGADDYSVQLAADQGGDANWISALDISLDEARMIAVTGRVITALKARDPRVAAVREVYGTLDGRNVAGWDAATQRPATADDSHLWHLHLSFYRSRAGDDHAGVLAVLLGNPLEDDMALSESDWEIVTALTVGATTDGDVGVKAPWWAKQAAPFAMKNVESRLTALLAAVLKAQGMAQADIDELQARPASTVTDAQVKDLGDRIAAALIAHPGNALTAADKPVIVSAVKEALVGAAQAEADALKG